MTLAIPLLALALAAAPAKQEQKVEGKPQYTGIGLIVGASVAGAASLGLTGAWMGLWTKKCPIPDPRSGPRSTAPYDEHHCTRNVMSVLWIPDLLANVTALVLAPAAGEVYGDYDAWRFQVFGEPKRRHRVIIGIGASLVAVGLPTLLLGPRFALIDGVGPVGIVTVVQLGASSLGAGIGLWTYGATYGKRTGTARFALLPQLAPDRVGLSVASRF